jgi:hypothetical protein
MSALGQKQTLRGLNGMSAGVVTAWPLTARAPDKVGISAAPPKVYTHIAAVGPTPRECGVYLIFGAGIQDIDLRPQ